MAKVYRIAVVVGADVTYGRQILLQGILRYPQQPFHMVFTAWPVDVRALPHVREWQPDGIIVNLHSPDLARGVQSFGVPTINLGENYPALTHNLPWVGVDDHAVGAMGANYLIEQGFRNFGFSHYLTSSSSGPFSFSVDRYTGFAQALQRAGFSCHGVEEQSHAHARWPKPYVPDNPEERWLRALPKPVAIMAANDIVGSRILEICRHASLRVPEDVAVLGVDNDDLVCLMSEVALSSIETPTEKIGCQSMSLMKRLFAGENLSVKSVLLPPLRVVERRSSNRLAVDDESLASAIQYIHDHISEPLSVDDIAEAIMVSRRRLEIKFRSVLRRGPAEQVRQERFDQARRMLVETNLPVTEIALRVGLNRAGALSILFQEQCQMTPSDYREKFGNAIEMRPPTPNGKPRRKHSK